MEGEVKGLEGSKRNCKVVLRLWIGKDYEVLK